MTHRRLPIRSRRRKIMMSEKEALKKAIEQTISNSYAEEFELLRCLFKMYERAEEEDNDGN